ncbi:2Fe-2S iron-sulfur cluster-binding protein [Polynucleobacter sp. MWH-HuK1]|uniref:2Fe-2S iron-sulfur cluster-binding protein n=1 Tax=Polynucleobacter sp. MWH-HuK1 TaxID=1743158 RepID=UPI001C0E328E|nr:2Fe-2S iron-sulfur cluster-binding protein [Polynucleobacter sp. MWH-HuK1]MBU3565617.1 2Fe-2S iron-sulfur cluster binding domain-containing protein [Polynucleobacter sp. MWH-HuK1]
MKIIEPLSLSINGENLPIEEGVLLNTLWAHLPDADCKEGECGGCRVKLLKGDIEWVRNPIYQLTDTTHILPCSCRAKTSLVCESVA